MIRIDFDDLFKEPLWKNGKAIARGFTPQESRALASAYRKVEADYGRLLTGHAMREEQAHRTQQELQRQVRQLTRIIDSLMLKPTQPNRARIRSAKKTATQMLRESPWLDFDEDE